MATVATRELVSALGGCPHDHHAAELLLGSDPSLEDQEVRQSLGRRAAAAKLFAAALGAAVLAALLAVASWRPATSAVVAATPRMLERSLCRAEMLTLEVGGGEVRIPAPDGSGVFEQACPPKSPKPDGRIRVECLHTGAWTLNDTACYDCAPEVDAKVNFDGQHARMTLSAGLEGDAVSRPCGQDGGEVTMTCRGGRWRVHAVGCRPRHLCAATPASIDFGGDIGTFSFDLSAGAGFTQVGCPDSAPEPSGSVQLECRAAKENRSKYMWQLVSQTCQHCAPGMATLGFKGNTAKLQLPGGKLGQNLTSPCTFTQGRSYEWGSLSYSCSEAGWRLTSSSCRKTACGAQPVTVRMRFEFNHRTLHSRVPIDLPGADPGVHDVPCATGGRSFLGNLTAECGSDGRWTVLRERCWS